VDVRSLVSNSKGGVLMGSAYIDSESGRTLPLDTVVATFYGEMATHITHIKAWLMLLEHGEEQPHNPDSVLEATRAQLEAMRQTMDLYILDIVLPGLQALREQGYMVSTKTPDELSDKT
jgi:hypothetical protein